MGKNLSRSWVARKNALPCSSMHRGAPSHKEWGQSSMILAQCFHVLSTWLWNKLMPCQRKTPGYAIVSNYLLRSFECPTVLSNIYFMACSVLSRYGVRSFPSILIACGPYAYWPVGSKELDSLVNVYTAVTGKLLYARYVCRYIIVSSWYSSVTSQ